MSVKLSVSKLGAKNAKVLLLRGESTKGGRAEEQCSFRKNRQFSEQKLDVRELSEKMNEKKKVSSVDL